MQKYLSSIFPLFIVNLFLGSSLLAETGLETRSRKGFYSSLTIGQFNPEDKSTSTDYFSSKRFGTEYLDNGSSYEFSIGYITKSGWMSELSYGKYKSNINSSNYSDDLSDGFPYVLDDKKYDLDLLSASILKEFNFNNSKFSPYIGAGIGIGNIHLPSFTLTFNESLTLDSNGGSTEIGSIYKLRGGLSYKTTNKIDIFSEIDYLVIPSFSHNNIDYSESNALTIKIGSRYHF